MILLALLLSAGYSVPSTPLAVVYMLTVSWSCDPVGNGSWRQRTAWRGRVVLILGASLAGTVIRLLAGLGLAIFALRVW